MSQYMEKEATEDPRPEADESGIGTTVTGLSQLFEDSTDSDSEGSLKDFITNSEEEDDYETLLELHNAVEVTEHNNTIEELERLLACKRPATSNPSTPAKHKHGMFDHEVQDTVSPQMAKMQINPEEYVTGSRRQLFNSPPDENTECRRTQATGRCNREIPGPSRSSPEGISTSKERTQRRRTLSINTPNSQESIGLSVSLPCGQSIRAEAEGASAPEDFGQEEHPDEEASQKTFKFITDTGPGTLESVVDSYEYLRASKDSYKDQLYLFKRAAGFSFMQLVRPFKNPKSQSLDWVVLNGSGDVEYMENVLKKSQDVVTAIVCFKGLQVVYLEFAVGKTKTSVRKWLGNLGFNKDKLWHMDPPNIRLLLNALFWFKEGHAVKGGMPQWVQKFFIEETKAQEDKFDLTQMVQWAMDNKYYDEPTICFQYAQEANQSNINAKLWLASTSQLRYARDCATMARNMYAGYMKSLSLSEYVQERVDATTDTVGRDRITPLLHYQGVLIYDFLEGLKNMLHRVPKKCCMCIMGPTNTGKSMFAMSLIKFFEGQVLSFYCSRSHFWLQPLANCRLALLDDAHWATWDYLDQNLRNGLDGNPIQIDCKNKVPIQIDCPPLLITTNYDFRKGRQAGDPLDEPKPQRIYKYLKSRVRVYEFVKPLVTSSGNTKWVVDPSDWKQFFIRYAQALGLEDIEDKTNGWEKEKPESGSESD